MQFPHEYEYANTSVFIFMHEYEYGEIGVFILIFMNTIVFKGCPAHETSQSAVPPPREIISV